MISANETLPFFTLRYWKYDEIHVHDQSQVFMLNQIHEDAMDVFINGKWNLVIWIVQPDILEQFSVTCIIGLQSMENDVIAKSNRLEWVNGIDKNIKLWMRYESLPYVVGWDPEGGGGVTPYKVHWFSVVITPFCLSTDYVQSHLLSVEG